MALRTGDIKLVKYLLEHSASVTSVENGCDALQFATSLGILQKKITLNTLGRQEAIDLVRDYVNKQSSDIPRSVPLKEAECTVQVNVTLEIKPDEPNLVEKLAALDINSITPTPEHPLLVQCLTFI